MTPPGTLSPALGQPDHSSFLRPPSSPRSPLAAQKHAPAPPRSASPCSWPHSRRVPACRHPRALPSIRAAARHSLSRKQVILMSTGIIVVVIVAVIVVAALVTGGMAIMRRRRLQQRFGPEYDRVAGAHDSNLKAD